jgi:hypothetical protein
MLDLFVFWYYNVFIVNGEMVSPLYYGVNLYD